MADNHQHQDSFQSDSSSSDSSLASLKQTKKSNDLEMILSKEKESSSSSSSSSLFSYENETNEMNFELNSTQQQQQQPKNKNFKRQNNIVVGDTEFPIESNNVVDVEDDEKNSSSGNNDDHHHHNNNDHQTGNMVVSISQTNTTKQPSSSSLSTTKQQQIKLNEQKQQQMLPLQQQQLEEDSSSKIESGIVLASSSSSMIMMKKQDADDDLNTGCFNQNSNSNSNKQDNEKNLPVVVDAIDVDMVDSSSSLSSSNATTTTTTTTNTIAKSSTLTTKTTTNTYRLNNVTSMKLSPLIKQSNSHNNNNNNNENSLINDNTSSSSSSTTILLPQNQKISSFILNTNDKTMAKTINNENNHHNHNNNNGNDSNVGDEIIDTSPSQQQNHNHHHSSSTSSIVNPKKSSLKSSNNGHHYQQQQQVVMIVDNNENLSSIDRPTTTTTINESIDNNDDQNGDENADENNIDHNHQYGSLNNNNNNTKLPHWSQNIAIYESLSNGDYLISGGSDYGQMPYFTETGDIIIEIDGEQVAGLTSIDIEQILSRSTKHTFKILTGQQHGFPLELREYLSRRFVRGSLDHKLQELIRDNIYSRTIPITTRPKRDNEIDGVDYRFVTKEQFIQMERSGLLLESGVYCNYYYGTALPSSTTNYSQENHLTNERKNDIINMKNDESSSWTTMSAMAKRKRNRSNLVAIDAASLPYGWERISDSHYGVYYIDHINKRTQYERPYEIELVKGINGFGFTLIEIDKGLIVVKSLIQGGSASASGVIQSGDVLVSVAGISVSGYQHSDIAQLFQTFNVGDRIRLTFARGYQLPSGINDEDYDIINLKIIKGFQGFGFTISEGHNGQKVKKILDIERCCSLRQGDILISINGMDLQQLQHLDVVELLKQCPVNESTEFMVKRKKRFRSKTPNNNQSMTMPMMTANNNNNNNDIDIGSSLRNCKTPNEELFYQQQQQQHYNTLPTWNNINNNNNESTIQITNTQQQNNNNNINNDNDYQQYCDQYNENLDDYNQMMMMANSAASVDNNNHLYSNQQPIKQLQQQQQQQMDNYSNFPTIMMNSSLKPSQSAPLLSTNDRSSGTLFGQIDIDYEYHQIILNRTDTGFGFRIIGGAEDGSNVAIGSIVIGGSAHKDGTLKAGDELIAINGQYVVGSSHQDVVQLMAQTGSQVTILVRRKRYLNAYDVQLFRQDYEGFGFVIISCGNCALIGRIIEGSPAHRCQRLHIRDRIIAVNGIDVTNMSHPEIVNKIKESDDTLLLRIVPADCYSCELIRGSNGYGFSIRGGAEFNGMPLFILAIATNGPASSLLQIGDEILEINERSTIGMTHQEAVQLISQSQPSVRLRMRHNYVGGEFFSTSLMSPPPPPPPQQQLSSISLPLPSSSSSSSQIIANRISSPQQQPPPPPPQSAGSPIMMQPVPSQSSSSSTAATVAATTAIANSSSSSSIPIQFPSTKYPSNMISY